jgi:hypothetical protein
MAPTISDGATMYWAVMRPASTLSCQRPTRPAIVMSPRTLTRCSPARTTARDRPSAGAPTEVEASTRRRRARDRRRVRRVNVWPAAFDAAVFGVPGVLDYRGRVSRSGDGERVELRVECEPLTADALLDSVRDAVRRRTGLSVEVTRVAPGSSAGRFERVS